MAGMRGLGGRADVSARARWPGGECPYRDGHPVADRDRRTCRDPYSLMTVVPPPRAIIATMTTRRTIPMTPMATHIGLFHQAPPPPRLLMSMSMFTLPGVSGCC